MYNHCIYVHIFSECRVSRNHVTAQWKNCFFFQKKKREWKTTFCKKKKKELKRKKEKKLFSDIAHSYGNFFTFFFPSLVCLISFKHGNKHKKWLKKFFDVYNIYVLLLAKAILVMVWGVGGGGNESVIVSILSLHSFTTSGTLLCFNTARALCNLSVMFTMTY